MDKENGTTKNEEKGKIFESVCQCAASTEFLRLVPVRSSVSSLGHMHLYETSPTDMTDDFEIYIFYSVDVSARHRISFCHESRTSNTGGSLTAALFIV